MDRTSPSSVCCSPPSRTVPVPGRPPGDRPPPARAPPRRRRAGPIALRRPPLTGGRGGGCRARRGAPRGCPMIVGKPAEGDHGRPGSGPRASSAARSADDPGPPPLRDLRDRGRRALRPRRHRPRPHVPDERGLQLQPRGDRRRRGLPLLRAAGPGRSPGVGRRWSSPSGSLRPCLGLAALAARGPAGDRVDRPARGRHRRRAPPDPGRRPAPVRHRSHVVRDVPARPAPSGSPTSTSGYDQLITTLIAVGRRRWAVRCCSGSAVRASRCGPSPTTTSCSAWPGRRPPPCGPRRG